MDFSDFSFSNGSREFLNSPEFRELLNSHLSDSEDSDIERTNEIYAKLQVEYPEAKPDILLIASTLILNAKRLSGIEEQVNRLDSRLNDIGGMIDRG